MRRFTLSFVTIGVALSARLARAESQAEIASRENDEGKELMYGGKYADASAKFRDAVARVPEAKYFFNLCTSLYQEGKFGEALTACDHAGQNNPDAKLKDKTDKLVARIKDEAKAQGVDLQPVGGGASPDPNLGQPDPNNPNPPDPNNGNPPDPNNPNPNPNPNPPPQPQYAVGHAPSVDVIHAVKPQHSYTWTIGVDLYGGGGQIGGKDANGNNLYGAATEGLRIKSDVMFAPALKLGGEGYLQFTHFGASSTQMLTGGAADLDIIDVGVGLYKHFCLPGVERLCLTPLLGVHLALMSPQNQTDGFGQVFNYAAVGARAEIAAHIALGPRYEHVFSVGVGANAYTGASGPSDPTMSASAFGIDTGGGFGYISLGYTYRFNTPLGGRPIIILE